MLITYQEELIRLGQTLDDAEFAITLLTSLPESWNNFIAGIDTTSLKDSSKLIARILEQYRRIKSANDDTALVAKNSGKFGNKRHPNIKCFKCGKKGHFPWNVDQRRTVLMRRIINPNRVRDQQIDQMKL